jgi:hypothetical protein
MDIWDLCSFFNKNIIDLGLVIALILNSNLSQTSTCNSEMILSNKNIKLMLFMFKKYLQTLYKYRTELLTPFLYSKNPQFLSLYSKKSVGE